MPALYSSPQTHDASVEKAMNVLFSWLKSGISAKIPCSHQEEFDLEKIELKDVKARELSRIVARGYGENEYIEVAYSIDAVNALRSGIKHC